MSDVRVPTASGIDARSRTVIGMCVAALVLEGYDVLMFGTVVPSLLAYKP